MLYVKGEVNDCVFSKYITPFSHCADNAITFSNIMSSSFVL